MSKYHMAESQSVFLKMSFSSHIALTGPMKHIHLNQSVQCTGVFVFFCISIFVFHQLFSHFGLFACD